MAEKTLEKKDEKATEVEVVTAEDLLKSIKDLEADPDGGEKAPESKTKQVELKKTAETINDKASAGLRKALDVSSALEEITSLIGLHNDGALEELRKAVNGSAERDLAFTRVLKDLKKSVDDLREKVEAYGKTPGGKPAGSFNGQPKKEPTKDDILNKGAASGAAGATDETDEQRARRTRRQVLSGLESLVKSAEAGSSERQEFINAAVKFEVSGEIKDETLHKALGAYKKANAI